MPPSDPNDQNNLSLLGSAPSFAAVMEQVSRAAPLDRPVLVIGERGTGKELVAARLHYLSKRWDRPRPRAKSKPKPTKSRSADKRLPASWSSCRPPESQPTRHTGARMV